MRARSPRSCAPDDALFLIICGRVFFRQLVRKTLSASIRNARAQLAVFTPRAKLALLMRLQRRRRRRQKTALVKRKKNCDARASSRTMRQEMRRERRRSRSRARARAGERFAQLDAQSANERADGRLLARARVLRCY